MKRIGLTRFLAAASASALVEVALGLLAGFAFVNPSPEPAPRQAVIEQAIAEAGAVWPGTEIDIDQQSPDVIEIERRWLGLTESRSTIGRAGNKWHLGATPDSGPAQALQLWFAVLLSVLVFLLTLRLT